MRELTTRFVCTFLTFLMMAIGANAQKKDTSRNGSTVIIFSNNMQQPGGSSSNTRNNTPSTSDKNIIKLSVFSFFSGYEEAYYEYVINGTLSVEAGLGITFHSYFEDIGYSSAATSQGFFGVGLDTVSTGDGYTDKYEDHTQHICQPGVCLTLAPRIYFKGNAPEDFYIQPHFQYKDYNFTGLMADTGYSASTTPSFKDGKTFPEHRTQLDFSIDLGYQVVNEKITFEILGGLGIRNVTEVRNNIGFVPSGGYPVTGGDFYNHTITYQESLLLMIFEFNIGYHF
ncbi:MAG TPA: hypothetical protein VNZ45_05715 [Bacteroidia bacterium]|nr:hypothetical protein [Bacteroidia bacterium]